MDLLKFVKDRGIFIKMRIGKKPFDGVPIKRTTAREDIQKRKEKDVKV